MGVAVSFNYQKWLARYPEFSNVSEPTAQECFKEAGLTHANDGTGPIGNADMQLMLLNMLTAHIAQLSFGSTKKPATGLVGRISSASEGSVSAQVQNDYPSGTPQWFQQTDYGSAYWNATQQFKTFRYRAPRIRRAGWPVW